MMNSSILFFIGILFATLFWTPIQSSDFLETKQFMNRMKAKQKLPDNVTCEVCVDFFTTIHDFIEANATYEEITSWAINFCIKYNIMDEYVCTLGVYEWAPEVLTIAKHADTTASNVCTDYVGVCNDPSQPNPWNVTFLGTPKPTPNPTPPKPETPEFRVLHISDTHYDANYTVGFNTDCGEPLCCRPPNGPGEEGYQAGDWGDYACDPPLNLFESLLTDAASRGLDFVLWTGDVPPHNVWEQTRRHNKELLYKSVSIVYSILGDSIPVYPSLGNHESAPVNSNPTPELEGVVHQSNQWLLDAAADAWKIWLPESALETIKYGGYYQIKHSDGLRIISLNMNYCNNQNWWLILNNTDPAGQLQWLINVLQDCEDTGDKAYLIGHIPPGHCLAEFGWNLYEIINRYESTVVATFWGHTHKDEFEIFYDTENITRAINVAYIAQSLTPYGDNNPGYKIYRIDAGETKQVINHHNYWTNLTLTNEQGKPIWNELYNAQQYYSLSNMLPQQWDSLLDRFISNDSLFQSYYDFRTRLGNVDEDCVDDCKWNTICDIQSARKGDDDFCTKSPVDWKLKYSIKQRMDFRDASVDC